MNKGCKAEMTLFGDVVYCQTWNVNTQNCTEMLHHTAGLSSCLVNITILNHKGSSVLNKNNTQIC
jgi:hypothetical protein